MTGGDEPEGDRPARAEIFGLVEDTHAAPAYFFDDAVVRRQDNAGQPRSTHARILSYSRGQSNPFRRLFERQHPQMRRRVEDRDEDRAVVG